MNKFFINPNGVDMIEWDGSKFVNNSDPFVLSYPMPLSPSGWNDDLTYLHEEVSNGNHPIDRSSVATAFNNVSRFISSPEGSVLEIGSSSGTLLRKLRNGMPSLQIVGSDIIDKPLRELGAALLGEGIPVPLLRFDCTQCPFSDGSFDVVIALNVLEHIQDDVAAIKEIYRILKPGGVFIFEVPSGSSLYDAYDKQMLHYRRYDNNRLLDVFEQTGFMRKRFSHLGFFMFPAFWLVKKWRASKTIKLAPPPPP